MAIIKSSVNIKAMKTVFLYSSVAKCSFIFCLVDLFVTLEMRMYLCFLLYLFVCMSTIVKKKKEKKKKDNSSDSKTLFESSRLNQQNRLAHDSRI